MAETMSTEEVWALIKEARENTAALRKAQAQILNSNYRKFRVNTGGEIQETVYADDVEAPVDFLAPL